MQDGLGPIALIERIACFPWLQAFGLRFGAFGCRAARVADEVPLRELAVVFDGGILRATRPPLDPDVLSARLAVLRALVGSGDPTAAAAVLWATLRAGRDDAVVGEPEDVQLRDEGETP